MDELLLGLRDVAGGILRLKSPVFVRRELEIEAVSICADDGVSNILSEALIRTGDPGASAILAPAPRERSML